ncbi:MAG TPA: glycosyl transferase family 2 [Candidatus Rokubacteria bacterium]|nr:MAG: hypothetical protein A2050_00270 [Candidatus Rokubacteria bacterium GWA2_73_35]HBH02047.1 glycosyl transferase family 2 [Candidatus Rokubacteria bacterium]
MTDTHETPAPAPPPALDEQLAALGAREIAVGLPTYNNAATVGAVVAAVEAGLRAHFPEASAVLIDADAGSLDRTPEALAAAGVPVVLARHEAPSSERAAVPFHGVPGRDAALRLTFDVARRVGARVLVVLEADVPSIDAGWIERLVRPVWEEKADLVVPAYARHRYEGTITNLLLAPLVRALFGRRLRQPLGGASALSLRLLEHALARPDRPTSGRDLLELWLVGAAIADGFALREAWLGPRRIESRTRTTDLPTMLAQALGAVFTLMERYEALWLDVVGSEPVPALGEAAPPAPAPTAVDVERLVGAFRRGVRDLVQIWELVLTPDTLGDVLSLEVRDAAAYRFPDPLWARVVYEFALGHHFGVVHRDHLLRSLVPLYLGRTAALVNATQAASAPATEAALERVGAAFERAKPYLVDRWR